MSLFVLLFLLLSILDHSLPRKSLGFIDYESLAMISSLLIVSRGMELSGIFSRFAHKTVMISGGSKFRLLSTMIIVAALSSAFVMNDTAIFIFIPAMMAISRISEIDLPEAVTLAIISSNIGSAISPIGNPQNIIIWRSYNLQFLKFIGLMSPYAILWLSMLLAFIWIKTRNKNLKTFQIPKIEIRKGLFYISASLLIVNVLLGELGLSFAGLVLTTVIMAIAELGVLLSFDVALLAIFALIFIDFNEISSLFFGKFFLETSLQKILLFSAILSQLVSNVPATVVLISQNVPWFPLAIGVNLGGTGMITGSLANFIGVRISGISLKDFHRYSLPYFLIALFLTVALMAIL